ncbi:DUF599 domain-containing protein [Thiorhodococcus mannitoliphagus]|uniref:DUF599 domain-containing protein n=1 Tax=Thiorhodococcus mannitoliphagus TaxID=329406 RepID=A0A6P1DNL1_9GAMM|nr:DUF599 domain-containing protein [Thiorhodococcus mannitoliphagus]NEX18783.1 DUF599 domain-containing protein [Thiorhodococcus mannitoliphagus]
MQDWWHEYSGDIIWCGFGAAVLIGYHLFLAIRVRQNPNFTVQSVNRKARRSWVQNIMAEPSHAILGVQTLRNSTMAATFFASTSVILSMGVLSLTGQADEIAQDWHTLNLFGSRHPGLWQLKLIVLLADLLIAFFSFAMSVRLYNHVGFQVSLPPQLRPAAVDPEQVAAHLNRAGSFYSAGMRAYYLAVPLVFWLFGPHLMAVASLLLVSMLYFMDRMPPVAAED